MLRKVVPEKPSVGRGCSLAVAILTSMYKTLGPVSLASLSTRSQNSSLYSYCSLRRISFQLRLTGLFYISRWHESTINETMWTLNFLLGTRVHSLVNMNPPPPLTMASWPIRSQVTVKVTVHLWITLDITVYISLTKRQWKPLSVFRSPLSPEAVVLLPPFLQGF